MTDSTLCLHCNKPFEPKGGKKYCSFECGGHNKKHGLTKTAEWKVWARMRRRCYSPQYHCYHRYGGRGIKICDRWGVFENFLADMGKRPTPKHTIERIHNDGDYEPSNCKWATMAEQNNNRSNTYTPAEDQALRDAAARGLSFKQAAELIGKSYGSVHGRVNRIGLKSGQPRGAAKAQTPQESGQ